MLILLTRLLSAVLRRGGWFFRLRSMTLSVPPLSYGGSRALIAPSFMPELLPCTEKGKGDRESVGKKQ